MTPQAKAHQLREVASRLQKLGASIPDPELLNGGDETLIAILLALTEMLEVSQANTCADNLFRARSAQQATL